MFCEEGLLTVQCPGLVGHSSLTHHTLCQRDGNVEEKVGQIV